jgi:nucleoside-diphosphate-sugar epimerase
VRAAKEAGSSQKIIAVSRFGGAELADSLRSAGAEVVSTDATDDKALAALPDAPNVIFLIGSKFGSTGNEAHTWYTNSYLPGRVAERFAGKRITALSTGNVYPLMPITSGGPTEETPPNPVGEYAMSCLGRERVMSHFAQRDGTPLALIRLNYAVEMRYGVLIDIAKTIHAGNPVDISMGLVNVVWQGFANEVILRSLLHASVPPFVLNLAGPETISVRQVAGALGAALGKTPEFTGTEAPSSLLSNGTRCAQLFGYPTMSLGELVGHTAAWIEAGLPLLQKPTGFQKRDGKF